MTCPRGTLGGPIVILFLCPHSPGSSVKPWISPCRPFSEPCSQLGNHGATHAPGLRWRRWFLLPGSMVSSQGLPALSPEFDPIQVYIHLFSTNVPVANILEGILFKYSDFFTVYHWLWEWFQHPPSHIWRMHRTMVSHPTRDCYTHRGKEEAALGVVACGLQSTSPSVISFGLWPLLHSPVGRQTVCRQAWLFPL